MATDVVIKTNAVEIKADFIPEVGATQTVIINSADLQLCVLDRRQDKATNPKPDLTSAAKGQRRRALVHDAGDKLTINYGSDYPEGVLIRGSCRVHLEGLGLAPLAFQQLFPLGSDGNAKPTKLESKENSVDVAQELSRLRWELYVLRQLVLGLLGN